MIDRLPLPIELPYEALADFCRRWKITKMEVFGSVLRDDFGPESDVDFLVAYEAPPSLFGLADAEEELANIVGRPVDIVSRKAIEASHNWVRRRLILDSAKTIYVA